MGATCTICRLPAAGAINESIRSGRSVRALAAELGVSRDALGRHARAHLGRSFVPPAATVLPEPNADPLDELVAALRVRALAGHPADTREYRLALAAQADARHAMPPTRDLATEPEWIALRLRVLDALDPFPEAHMAVVAALEDMA